MPPASRATQSPSPSLPPVIFPPLPAPLPLLPPQALSRDLQQPSATSPSLVLLQLRPLCCACQALEGPVKFTSCGKSPPARHTAQRSQGVGGTPGFQKAEVDRRGARRQCHEQYQEVWCSGSRKTGQHHHFPWAQLLIALKK